MLIKRGRDWEINQREVTDEALFLNRRSFIKSITAGAILAPSMVGFGSSANAKKKKMEIQSIVINLLMTGLVFNLEMTTGLIIHCR